MGVCWWLCVCYLTWHDYPSLVEGESRGILLLYNYYNDYNSCIMNTKFRHISLKDVFVNDNYVQSKWFEGAVRIVNTWLCITVHDIFEGAVTIVNTWLCITGHDIFEGAVIIVNTWLCITGHDIFEGAVIIVNTWLFITGHDIFSDTRSEFNRNIFNRNT